VALKRKRIRKAKRKRGESIASRTDHSVLSVRIYWGSGWVDIRPPRK
jgi:hypothetical protein